MITARWWVALILVPLLIVPQVYAATSNQLALSTSIALAATSGSSGSGSWFCPAGYWGSPNPPGGIINQGGVTIAVLYIPLIQCFASGSYSIQPVCGSTTSTPCPPFPTLSDYESNNPGSCPTWNPLSWGSIFSCIGGYIGSLVTWLGQDIVITIINSLIGGIDQVAVVLEQVLAEVANLFISVLDTPIDIFNGFNTALGDSVLGAVLSVGEPWSAFLAPIIWLVPIAVIALTLIAGIWLASKIKGALVAGAEVAAV